MPREALGLAIQAAADHADQQQDDAHGEGNKKQQDDHLKSSDLERLPARVMVDSSLARGRLSRRSASAVEQPGSSDSGGSATIGA